MTKKRRKASEGPMRREPDAVARRIRSRRRIVITDIESVLRRHGVDAQLKELHVTVPGAAGTVVCRKQPDGTIVCTPE